MVQLVKRSPGFVGYTDACATGMGGVWFSGNKRLENLCWRVPFPKDIVDEVISDVNPKGRLTNSYLELAAALVHYDVLCLNTDMRSRLSAIFSDNTPTVAWCTKMADNSISPVAGRLLRGFSMFQRQELSAPVLLAHVIGDENKMADYSSRSYNTVLITATNTQFLAVFNSTFPIQDVTWTSASLPTEIISNVISSLSAVHSRIANRLPHSKLMTFEMISVGRDALVQVTS